MRLNNYLRSLLAICLFPLAIYAVNQEITEWKLKISVEKAFVRLKPDMNSPVESTVAKGTILQSHEKVEEWYRVVIGPDESGFVVIGYIHSDNVEIIAEKIVLSGKNVRFHRPFAARCSPLAKAT